MKKKSLIFLILLLFTGLTNGFAQSKPLTPKPRVEVYYFHPNERCPIDQSIEENTIKLMNSNFAKEIKDGTIRFQIINTDDKSQAKTVALFEINAQALYVVNHRDGKEIKNDLTHFAFTYGLSNPERFKNELKEEIDKELKQ
jgi:hypothetical protein